MEGVRSVPPARNRATALAGLHLELFGRLFDWSLSVRRHRTRCREAITLRPVANTTAGHSSIGHDMHFGATVSLVLALLAVVDVFVEIPLVNNYAFGS
jgi:hypothetical protein